MEGGKGGRGGRDDHGVDVDDGGSRDDLGLTLRLHKRRVLSGLSKATVMFQSEKRDTHVFLSFVPDPRSLLLLPPVSALNFLAPTTTPLLRTTSPPGIFRVDVGFSAVGQTHSRPAFRQRLQSGFLKSTGAKKSAPWLHSLERGARVERDGIHVSQHLTRL